MALYVESEVRGMSQQVKKLEKNIMREWPKEVQEALAKPGDVEEYADLLHLLLDASDRAGFTFTDVLAEAVKKLKENIMREWPKVEAKTEQAEPAKAAAAEDNTAVLAEAADPEGVP